MAGKEGEKEGRGRDRGQGVVGNGFWLSGVQLWAAIDAGSGNGAGYWLSDDRGAVRARAAGFHYAFGAHDGVRFGDEGDAEDDRRD